MTKFTFKIFTDIAIIKQHLTDVDKFVSVHPLIYKMTDLGHGKYKVHEKIKIGFIHYRFTYKATISQRDNIVNIDASIMGLTKLSMQFMLQKEDEGTLVHETLSIKSVLPIKDFMKKLIQEQHQVLFKNIEIKGNE